MVYNTAVAHCMAAAASVQVADGAPAPDGDVINGAAKRLKAAAGAMDLLATTLIPAWRFQALAAPETRAVVAEGLSALLLAQAQQLALVKAATSCGVAVQAKLHMGLHARFRDAFMKIRSVSEGVARARTALLVDVEFAAQLHRGMAYLQAAEAAYDAEDPGRTIGEAVARARLARVHTHPRHNVGGDGLPPVPEHARAQWARRWAEAMQARAVLLEGQWEAENNAIYYNPVPPPNDLPAPGAVAMGAAEPCAWCMAAVATTAAGGGGSGGRGAGAGGGGLGGGGGGGGGGGALPLPLPVVDAVAMPAEPPAAPPLAGLSLS
jgi:uncharacterized membrane protein YgcG